MDPNIFKILFTGTPSKGPLVLGNPRYRSGKKKAWGLEPSSWRSEGAYRFSIGIPGSAGLSM